MEERLANKKNKGYVIWLTGISGAGKSSLASELNNYLSKKGTSSYILDGDCLRTGLNSDLTFSHKNRSENIRRVGEVAKLFANAGFVVIAALISPYRLDRERVRQRFKKGEFIEVFVNCPINTCEERDPKGLYKKARLGSIEYFTGLSDPYENPLSAELTINTDMLSLKEGLKDIVCYLKSNGYL